MTELPKYYTTLFNAVTDALEELRKNNYAKARLLLETGQCQAEELYVSEADSQPKPVAPPGTREETR